ncbi:uncharacterized protein LOC106512397 [Austrofundulus limnaeus]|uniref:Uncharacterized protein LOC106512397 n=1 Tax=Austrofundulus limnaeus TaxID=52670 RepID=A0A2I4ALU6_AUSLI|nr:PREDICTED: uncharacterized protein LOC106512397 [Austrofundulus limnaeus]
MNDGRGTRIDVHTGNCSAIDLTLVSKDLAGLCEWEVEQETTIGSDHFPIFCRININKGIEVKEKQERWIFGKAKWDVFKYMCEKDSEEVDLKLDIEDIEEKIREVIMKAAKLAIPISKGKRTKKEVPWWTQKCSEAIRKRNQTFRILRRTHNYQNLIEYKKAQAEVRKVIKKAKKTKWRDFCDTIGRTTPLAKVWGMIKKMRGNRCERNYPILKFEQETAITNEKKVEIMAKTFAKIHSSDNLSEHGKYRRNQTQEANKNILDCQTKTENIKDSPFSIQEMKRAIDKTGLTAPGKDQICYIMLKHLGNQIEKKTFRTD